MSKDYMPLKNMRDLDGRWYHLVGYKSVYSFTKQRVVERRWFARVKGMISLKARKEEMKTAGYGSFMTWRA